MRKGGIMRNMENNKFIEWDFSNPAHEAYFLNCFNGEETMRQEYPVLYGMLRHTKMLAGEDGEARHALKTGGAAGYVDRAHIHELVVRKSNRNDDAGQNDLYCMGCTSLVSVKPAVHVTLEIYKNGKRIARNFQTRTNVQYLELECLAEESGDLTPDDDVKALISCFWNEPESDILRGGYMQETLRLEGGKYVADVVCENPRKRIAGEDTIVISYGRGSAGNVDYCYPEGKRDKDGNQRVTLNVNGSVKLSDAVFLRYKDHDMSMFSVTKGVITYNGAAPVCEKTENGFSWKYDLEWQDSIESSVKYGQHQYEFDMRLEFVVQDKDGKEQEQYIDVSSVNSEAGSNIVIVPPMTLLWGCLGRDTLVRMADGSVKKISEIVVGEWVATPGGSAAVSKVWTGREEEIYHIKTDSGREILATGEHQFRTDGGYVRVLDLTSSTRLMTDEGGTMQAVYCYAQAYQDTVYSLDLEDGDSFFAAGFVSGTMKRQNMVCGQNILPPVREDLQEELEKLDRQIGEGEIFRAESVPWYEYCEVSMTVKNGKVVLNWTANYSTNDDWVGLYRNASDGNDKYIGGAWQWAAKGTSYQTDVYVSPGLQARYIRGTKNYICLAKTDPFPAVDEAVEVNVFGGEKQVIREETVDEAFYEKTPEEAAEILRQQEQPESDDAGYSIFGRCMLGYKKGKFIIDWTMVACEPYDWIGLYKNSSAGQNDYATYQWVEKKAPFETKTAVNAGWQIRYYRWSKQSKKYVEAARTNGFKELTIKSNTVDYPYRPDSALFSTLQRAFPYLAQADTTITGADIGAYNCIAWSLGLSDRWINPAGSIEAFTAFYIQAGCEERAWYSADAAVAAWADREKPTHGSRLYQEGSGLWESKLGQSYRITHGKEGLRGSVYGEIVNYFTAPKKFMAKRERTQFTARQHETLGRLVDETDNGLREPFESAFAKLKEGWHSEAFRYEASTESIRRLPVYTELLEMGTAVLPFLVAKLAEEENFFALPLYDEMQSDGLLRISYQDERYKRDAIEGEQERARRSVAAYLER